MRRSSSLDLCRMGAKMATEAVPKEKPYKCIMSIEAVPNKTENDL